MEAVQPNVFTHSRLCQLCVAIVHCTVIGVRRWDNSLKFIFRKNSIMRCFTLRQMNLNVPAIELSNYVVMSEGHIDESCEAQWETCQLDPWLAERGEEVSRKRACPGMCWEGRLVSYPDCILCQLLSVSLYKNPSQLMQNKEPQKTTFMFIY